MQWRACLVQVAWHAVPDRPCCLHLCPRFLRDYDRETLELATGFLLGLLCDGMMEFAMSSQYTADIKHYRGFSTEPAAAGTLLQVGTWPRPHSCSGSCTGCCGPVRLAGVLMPLHAPC